MMKWELFSLKERWLGGELTEIFKLPMGYYKIKLEDQFEVSWQTRNRDARFHTLFSQVTVVHKVAAGDASVWKLQYKCVSQHVGTDTE